MTRYEQGFLTKCAEYGVDGTELLKEARMKVLPRARKSLLRLKQLFTGELAKKVEDLNWQVGNKYGGRTKAYWDMVSKKKAMEKALRDVASGKARARNGVSYATRKLESVDDDIATALSGEWGMHGIGNEDLIKAIQEAAKSRFGLGKIDLKNTLRTIREEQLSKAKDTLSRLNGEAEKLKSEGFPKYEELIKDLVNRDNDEILRFGPRVLGDADRLEKILRKTDRLKWTPFRGPNVAKDFSGSTTTDGIHRWETPGRNTGTFIRKHMDRIRHGDRLGRYPTDSGRWPDSKSDYERLLSDDFDPAMLDLGW